MCEVLHFQQLRFFFPLELKPFILLSIQLHHSAGYCLQTLALISNCIHWFFYLIHHKHFTLSQSSDLITVSILWSSHPFHCFPLIANSIVSHIHFPCFHTHLSSNFKKKNQNESNLLSPTSPLLIIAVFLYLLLTTCKLFRLVLQE